MHDLEHTGTTADRVQLPLRQEWVFPTGEIGYSSPAVSEGRVFVGSREGSFYAVDASTGEFLWEFQTEGPVEGSPAVAGGTVFVGSYDGCLYALDAATGKERWRYETGAEVFTSPAVSGGAVYFGSFTGEFMALNALNGKRIWKQEARSTPPRWSRGAGSSPPPTRWARSMPWMQRPGTSSGAMTPRHPSMPHPRWRAGGSS
ncbi:MAG: PQQ-binding-like beta-propeller repeat protein [Euryarchaeota archaeon]|nr:PQQ-binding-like beta-propeller repeat protein [Euryarchaeota archaeon]